MGRFNLPKLFSGMFIKLFGTSFLIGVILFVSLLYYYIHSSSDALQRQKYDDMTLLINRTGQYLDLYVQNIKNSILLMTGDEDLLSNHSEKMGKILKKYVTSSSGAISHIFLIGKDGSVVSSSQTVYEIVGARNLDRLYRMAMENNLGVSWSEPYYSSLVSGNTVAFLRPMQNSQGETTHVVAIEVDLTELSNQMGAMLSSRTQTFAVITETGKVVVMPGSSPLIAYKPGTYPREMEDAFIEALVGLSNGIDRLRIADKWLMSVKSNNNQLGWNLVVLIDENTFHQNIKTLVNNFITFGLVYFLGLLAANLIISRHFTQPIHELAWQMDSIKDVVKAKPRLISREDEIGRLFRSFQDMIQRINELIQRQKEIEENKKQVEFKMLQSQIHPHFLGNTLACIGSLARQQRTAEVQEMIRSLILLLASSIDKIEDFISLKAEVLCLEAYVKIQKIKYGDVFDLNIQIPAAHEDFIIPKLLLQPLVENSIFHGFSDKKDRGRITIKTLKLESTFHIFVIDNGAGMEEEMAKRAVSAGSPGDAGKGTKKARLSNIGLLNIQERVKLYYGDASGIYITSEKNIGTQVEICLPYREHAEEA